MDLAKQFGQWKEQSPEQWIRTANRYFPNGVTAILVLAIAYQLARLTWAIVPGAPLAAVPAARAGGTTNAGQRPASDYTELLAAHPWDEAPKEAAPVVPDVADAPDTTLSLNLTGILAVGDGDPDGQAIMSANRGEEKTYHVGQAIDNANGTTLHSVYADRVLLNRGDRLETLRLPKELIGATGSPRAKSPVMAPPVASPTGNESLRNVISQNASRLTEIIRLSPNVDQGKVTGFRVQPGRDRDTFEALGLKAGDVVTDINGVTLDDASKGLQAFEALGEATMANVTVLRDGSPQALVIDTTQLQSIKENRQ